MHYFFREGIGLAANREVDLAPGDINRAYRVLRLRKGAAVTVADGRGAAFRGVIVSAGPAAVKVWLVEPVPGAESPLKITLLQALAKGEKMDLIIRQAVELGVDRIVPVVTARSIPRWNEAREAGRRQRWRAIIRAAAAQSRRAGLPAVEPVQDFAAVPALLAGRTALVPWEEESGRGLDFIFEQAAPEGAVFIFIGPEGGITPGEMAALEAAGAKPVHLGPRILRVETAAAVTLALVQAAWGDLGAGRG